MNKEHLDTPLTFLTEALNFPPVEQANTDGLLAAGGDLMPERLLLAYRNGIFPWYNEGSLILWWSPDPRMVLFPEKVKISKSMRKVFRNNQFSLTKNQCFERVIDHCSVVKRQGEQGTWITSEMKNAYTFLYEHGFAKSYEVWQDDQLVGGLYGVDLGNIFCGESMFSLVDNASKFAFICLAQELQLKKYHIIDCQLPTKHLESLGAEPISRKRFMDILRSNPLGH